MLGTSSVQTHINVQAGVPGDAIAIQVRAASKQLSACVFVPQALWLVCLQAVLCHTTCDFVVLLAGTRTHNFSARIKAAVRLCASAGV